MDAVKMNKLTNKIIVSLMMLLVAQFSFATTIYKCRAADGSLSYSQSPCQDGETLVRSKDLSKRLGSNAEKAKKRLEKILERKNNRLRNKKERKKRNRYGDRHQRNNTDYSNSDTEKTNLDNSESGSASNGGGTSSNSSGGSSSGSETTKNEEESTVVDTNPSETESVTETEPTHSDVSQPDETTNEVVEETETVADASDTSAPDSGGGSPNELPNETTINVGELYGPIEFEIISWPLTKAYPGLEYNIRMGVIGGQFPYLYELQQSPEGMNINPSTGEISWTPNTSSDGSSVNVTVTVTDSTGGKLQQAFSINVTKAGFYFVSPTGSDSSGNGSIGKPWKTMDTAISRAGSDAIVYLRGGTYKGAFSIDTSDANKWIAYPGEKPVIDMNLSTFNPRSNYGYIDGLEIINAQHWAFSFTGQDNWVFRRNHMHHLYDNSFSENPSFIFFWDESAPNNRAHEGFVIQDNVFHDLFDRASGINGDNTADFQAGSSVMYNVYKVLYENNEAYNIDGFGVKDKDHGQYNTFRGNYFHDNARMAFALSNQYSGNNVEILYNVFIGSVFVGQEPGDLGYVLFRHNTVIGQLMHKDARPFGDENTFVIIDNIISMKQADKSKVIDWADSETNAAYPYLCCNQQDGEGFVGPILYRDRNLIDYDSSMIAGWGWGVNRTLEQWQALGFDQNSIFADPQFNDAEERDFSPLSSSPACGKAHDGGDIGALKCM